MKCPKCGSEDVTTSVNTYTKSKKRSFLWNLLMILLTGGIWILWMCVRARKEEVVKKKYHICQNCGKCW